MAPRERFQHLVPILAGLVSTLVPAVAFASDTATNSVILIAYASLGLAGLLGIAGWIWWSYDLRRSQEAMGRSEHRPVMGSTEHIREQRRGGRPNTGEFRVEPSSTAEQVQVVLRSAQSEADSELECPRCSRHYPQGIVVCPIDATALQPRRRRSLSRTPVAPSEPTCGGCGRVYAQETRFCYHDGRELGPGQQRHPRSFHVCKSCGWETAESVDSCPHDGGPLTEIDPTRQESIQPTIPMMTCRKCGLIGSPSQTTCPKDGTMLYPLMNVRLSALPTHGVGPRRKVCTACGRSYSRAGNYCAHDGEKLTPLN